MYSLGIVLFEMVHGNFETGMERLTVLSQLRQNPPILPPEYEHLKAFLRFEQKSVQEKEDSYDATCWRTFFWLMDTLLTHEKRQRLSSKELHIKLKHRIPEIKGEDAIEWQNQLQRI